MKDCQICAVYRAVLSQVGRIRSSTGHAQDKGFAAAVSAAVYVVREMLHKHETEHPS